MFLEITHETLYQYSESVFLEPHYLHFHPQQRPNIELISFDIDITPEPSGLYVSLNSDNNIQHQCWFNEVLCELQINVKIKVKAHEFNPFGFFIDDQDIAIQNHKHFINQPEQLSDELIQWIGQFQNMQNQIDLITKILTEIHSNWGHHKRYEANIHEANECFSNKKGSCRDLSWMLMLMLRYLNIPARFVSGYAYNEELGEGHELHAWVDCYVQGAGWVGIDPSAGVFITDKYIPVATSPNPRLTLPVNGTYRGHAQSNLKTKVSIKEL